jgi:uncharacterized protein YbjT (DUF2867 family)
MRILVTGATGLVGQGVLRECLQADDVARIGALVRSGGLPAHPKLEEIVAPDFADLAAVEPRLQPFDACLYCAGMLPPGLSETAYRRVTLDLTLHVAQTLARLNPSLAFVYVSGAMSDPGSHLMPLRVKGETERALSALPIRTVMFRPGAVQPVEGVHSPHPARAALYRLAGPALDLGVKFAPQLLTTTGRMGRAMLAVLRQPDPPAVVENAEINRLGA